MGYLFVELVDSLIVAWASSRSWEARVSVEDDFMQVGLALGAVQLDVTTGMRVAWVRLEGNSIDATCRFELAVER